MSRLDEELRMAFRREQPPVDFTDRVLAKIARQPAPRVGWWQRLAESLQPPKLKWVAIGATAALLVAIGSAQYARLHPAVTDDSGKMAQTGTPTPEAAGKTADGVTAQQPVREAPAQKVDLKPHSKVARHVIAASTRTGHKLQTDRVVSPEAEAAKEKVMLALHIASTTLSDAQNAIRDDDTRQQR